MKENTIIVRSPHIKHPSSPFSRTDFLTQEEEDKLVSSSYLHQYGILVRLALSTGLNMAELLGLQWVDLDPDNKRLHIQNTFGVTDCGYELCRKDSPRFVSLPAPFFKELADWHEEQVNILAHYQLNVQCDSVASTLKGCQILPNFMEYYFNQILTFCGLPEYAFSILRDTFAARAIMRGASPCELCRLLGDPHAEKNYADFYSYLKKNWYSPRNSFTAQFTL